MSRSRNNSPGRGMWMISQVRFEVNVHLKILALIYVIVAILAMIATSKSSTFGIAIFFLMLWNVIILIGLFVSYLLNSAYVLFYHGKLRIVQGFKAFPRNVRGCYNDGSFEYFHRRNYSDCRSLCDFND